MDASKFDELTRVLAQPTSRRQALKTIVVTTLGGLLGLGRLGTAFGAPKCHRAGLGCDTNSNCCSNVCCNGRCCTSCQICSSTNTCVACPAGTTCKDVGCCQENSGPGATCSATIPCCASSNQMCQAGSCCGVAGRLSCNGVNDLCCSGVCGTNNVCA
jgi:hypothetical protein